MKTRARLAVTLMLALLTGLAAAPRAQQPPAGGGVPGADQALRPVKERFAPDRRLVHFDVKTRMQNDVLVVEGDIEGAEAKQAALKALADAGYARVEDRIKVLPDPELGAKRFGIVRVSVANVKSRPSHMADMVTQTVMGWTLKVLGSTPGWYYVHTDPDGYLGWVEELQVALVDEAGLRAWDTAARAVVTTPYAVVHAQASVASPQVTDAVTGAVFRATGREGEWTAVSLADGRQGFVPSVQVEPFDAWKAGRRPTPDNVERAAQLFMGVPYLWGGTSSKGFDCSGYTKTVLRMNGIDLPRDADQQGDAGTAVPIDDQLSAVRKGDLLFFGSKATADRPERITHVAIYVGNGEFLHASGLVRRNSLFPASPIYSESLRARLLRIRRVLP
jgi:cell wall-associated NlpC family hydrolase